VKEPLTFHNVEAQVCVYLTPLLGIPAVRVLPATLPADFVRVMLTGSTRRNLSLSDARVTLECWAPVGKDADAESLGRRTYAYMCAFATETAWVPLGADGWTQGPYADIDPDTKRPRYVMTANVRQATYRL